MKETKRGQNEDGEKVVRDALEGGDFAAVQHLAKPIYDGASKVPTHIVVQAIGEKADGSFEGLVNIVIENSVGAAIHNNSTSLRKF